MKREKPAGPRKLVVIGGTAGGASAAARARRIDESAEVVLLERGPWVSTATCGLAYHLGGEIPSREALQVQTPEGLRSRYRIDVRTRSEAVAIDRAAREVEVLDHATGRVYRERYDALILSPGASPVRPPIPGADHPRALVLRTLGDLDAIKSLVDGGARRAVVVGGGFIGLEMAENFARRGLHVDLVEMSDQVMPPLDPEMATPVHQELSANGIGLHLRTAVTAIESRGEGIAAVLSSGEVIEADLALLAVGLRPETRLAAAAGLAIGRTGGIKVDKYLRTSDPHIYAVGDAVEVKDRVLEMPAVVPLAGPANRQGRLAADNALGRARTWAGSIGTSIVRVFGLTVAATGAGEKTLRRAGLRHEKVYLHPLHHAGYFPGGRPISLKLLFAQDGRVLGAQAVGTEGVDKRIDVISTVIGLRGSVFDLEDVELAYAPQYGAAKDPVNMAGFVASNVLRGDLPLVHVESLPIEGAVLLDVRSPKEHEAGSIPGSTLIPLDDLRGRLGELPPERPIVVYCQVGLRGYLATRLLRQAGLKAWSLSGGYRTWLLFHPPGVSSDPGATSFLPAAR